MPFYRVNGMSVHMRGRKLPEPCRAHIWVDGKELLCLAFSGFLCDFPEEGGRTCDRALCEAHVHLVGPNRHYCPEHQCDAVQRQPQLGLFTGLVPSKE